MTFVRLLTCSAIISLVACGPRHDPMADMAGQRQQLVSAGHSQAYAEGYADGCSSAKNSRGDTRYNFIKNEPMFVENDDYALAWKQGYKACEGARHKVSGGLHVKSKDHERYVKSQEGKRVWDELKK